MTGAGRDFLLCEASVLACATGARWCVDAAGELLTCALAAERLRKCWLMSAGPLPSKTGTSRFPRSQRAHLQQTHEPSSGCLRATTPPRARQRLSGRTWRRWERFKGRDARGRLRRMAAVLARRVARMPPGVRTAVRCRSPAPALAALLFVPPLFRARPRALTGWLTLNHSINASRDGSSPSPFHLAAHGGGFVHRMRGACGLPYFACAYAGFARGHLSLAASQWQIINYPAIAFFTANKPTLHKMVSALFGQIIRGVIIKGVVPVGVEVVGVHACASRRFRCRLRDRPPFGSQHMRHVPRASWRCSPWCCSSWCPRWAGRGCHCTRTRRRFIHHRLPLCHGLLIITQVGTARADRSLDKIVAHLVA